MSPGSFSFVENEYESILRNAGLYLPGIQKIAVLFYAVADKKVRIISRGKGNDLSYDYDDVLDSRERLIMIQKFRQSSQPFSWIRREEVPFEYNDGGTRLGDIFSEMEHVVLTLRFSNEADHLSDIIFIYFNRNFGNFKIKESDKVLSTDNKVIIGNLLYNQFKSILHIGRADRQVLNRLNHGVGSLIRENLSLKDQLQQIRVSYGESMVNLAMQHINDLSQRSGQAYLLSADALDKIREYRGNPRYLPDILDHAVSFAQNLLFAGDIGAITINAYCLDFDSYQSHEKNEQLTKKIDSRQSRSMQLLDRLERAAALLKSRNQPLTSANVGRELDPPVTAPAITDALGKNKEIIRQLLEKYPEKWEIIRSEFRPLLNQVRKARPGFAEEESA